MRLSVMIRPLALSLLLSLLLTSRPHTAAASPLLERGDLFPEVAMPAPDDPGLRAYLGLPDRPEFTLSQVEGDVVLVEILNTLCPHCRRQTGPNNELYRRIENDPATRGRIRLLAVAVANNRAQIEQFVATYQVPFPVIADQHFTLHRAIGGSRTPFSIYVRQDPAGGPGVVAGTHLGLNREMDKLFADLKDLASRSPAEITATGPATDAGVAVEPVLSPATLEDKIRSTLAGLGDEVTTLKGLALPGGREVYRGEVRGADRTAAYFAEVARRPSICDICHDVHFIYVIDGRGKIVAFEPIQLTKWENARWSEEEVEQMRRRLLGKQLAGNWPFDPETDAVTRATMTSAIIFDVLEQGEELLEELRRERELD